MKKLPIEGTVFLVPLRAEGYAVGVLARANGEGQCFGYFFGRRVMGPDEVNVSKLAPEDAVLKESLETWNYCEGNGLRSDFSPIWIEPGGECYL